MAKNPAPDRLENGVVRVGAGRGFLVGLPPWPHAVVTAAHCLPELPAARGAFGHDHTYFNLLGPIGGPLSVSAACLFVDPIADLAVLASPDGQAAPELAEAYEQFVEDRPTFSVGSLAAPREGWLLSLPGRWTPCRVDVSGGGRGLQIIGSPTKGGQSGSPIVVGGRAIGLVSCGSESGGVPHEAQHGQPALVPTMPGWLLVDLVKPVSRLGASIIGMRIAWERYLRRSFRTATKERAVRRRPLGGR